ncbi:MAG: transglycosylase SLT domain-containing protein [Gammaproteobacteria bacterium]
MFLWVGVANAASDMSSAPSDPLVAQRADFLAAEQALKQGDGRRYATLKKLLVDYPLYPYLEHAELDGRLSRAKAEEVASFLSRYADVPVSHRLRGRWLALLKRRGDWKAYLEFARESRYPGRECTRLWALTRVGRTEEAMAQVAPLWNVGKSQPKACDPLFALWRKGGGISADLAWSRLGKAMGRGQISLARYLVRYLDKPDKAIADAWIRLRAAPRRVLTDRRLRSDTPRVRTALVYGLRRLARRDVEKAAAAWGRLGDRYRFSPEQQARVLGAIGSELAEEGDGSARDWFLKVPEGASTADIRAQAVKAALVAEDWDSVLEWIGRMDREQRNEDNWRYWAARAHEARGDEHEANKVYAGLSLTRGFYGFLAADRIGVSYTMGDEPIQVTPAVAHATENAPGVLRARELHRLGRSLDARREWRDAVAAMDNTQKAAAARVADGWGWHDQAIFTAAKAGEFDDLRLRFPLAFRSKVSRHAGRQKIDMAWVYGVMRQESAFAHDARSSAGAMGLMQLMPATARDVARNLRFRLRGTRQLFVPDTNIKLGTRYLRMMLDDLDQHPVLATAAYNAGPHRAKRWRPKDRMVPADIWIELIPFKETREYVRRVFAYTVVYEERIGLTPRRLSSWLKPILPEGGLTGVHGGGDTEPGIGHS